MRFSSFKTAQQVQSLKHNARHAPVQWPSFQQNFYPYSSTTHHSSNKLVNISMMYIILNCKKNPSLMKSSYLPVDYLPSTCSITQIPASCSYRFNFFLIFLYLIQSKNYDTFYDLGYFLMNTGMEWHQFRNSWYNTWNAILTPWPSSCTNNVEWSLEWLHCITGMVLASSHKP